MENGAVDLGQRLDPEAQAGQALRRLRLARNWSQEEVAVRMTAYGYDFHQTMIAKIEAAQRPLRVRELADFAALYGVEVQDLVYPPTGSLSETDQEIAEIKARRNILQAQAFEAGHQLEAAREAMGRAEVSYQTFAREIAVLDVRLTSLQDKRQRLIGWDIGEGVPFAHGGDKAEPSAPDSKASSIVPATGGPRILRILLGAQLRRLREAKQISLEDAGYAIRASSSKVRRLEAGRIGIKDLDLADLLTLYSVTEEDERQSLQLLARRANAPGWWHDYSDILPNWFETFIELEAAATEIQIFEVQFLPGLLQTEDYAQAVTNIGHDGMPAREIERRVQLRMARQAVLDRADPPDLHVVFDEAILERPVGNIRAVMRDQLQHLVEVAKRPNMTIQMLPLSAGTGSTAGSFTILRFAEVDLPDVVYLEQLTSALYLETPEDINGYLRVMRRLSAQALSPRDTTEFLKHLRKQYLSA